MEKNLKNTPEMENVNENAAEQQVVKTPFYKKGWFKKAMIALGAAAVIGGGVLVAKKAKARKATEECEAEVETTTNDVVETQQIETPRDRYEERRNNRWGGEDRPRHNKNNN